MNEHSIKVEKTAHYYSLGALNKNTKELWIVCHGYGQLASFFLKKFENIESENRFIVAPEGFNKFYLKGYHGRVGASWMTKEKRLDEIEDHCVYLEQLLDAFTKEASASCKIHLLGFSQGSATVSRWILRTKHKIDTLIQWGGEIANDFDFKSYQAKQSNTKNYMVFGTEDEFYTLESVQKYREEMKGFKAEWISYNGAHTIDSDCLIELANKLK